MFPRPGCAYNLVSAGAPDKVLGCAGGNVESGTQLVLWDRDGTPNQNWIPEQIGANLYRFSPQHAPGQFLDTNNGVGENACHLWDGAGNGDNQAFTLEPAGGHNFIIRRACDGAVLDVKEFGTQNGSTLWAWGECTRAPNQLWSFHFPGGNGPRIGQAYHIVSAGAPDKVLGCAGGNVESGTQVVLWDRDGSENQKWKIEHLNNGLIKFAPCHAPGQHLDTNNGVAENACHLWDDGGVPENQNQVFFVEPAGDGRHGIIRRACDGAVLDVKEFGTQNGSTLWVFPQLNRTPNQLWAFEPAH